MTITSEQAPDDDDTMAMEPLFIEPIVLFCQRASPPAGLGRNPATGEKLDFIRYGHRRRISQIIKHQFDRFGVETRGNLEFDSSVALFDFVKNGHGFAAGTPLCIYCGGLTENDVEIVTFPDVTPMRSINAIWMREREDTSVHMVTQLCRSIFSELIPCLAKRAGAAADRVQVLKD